MVEVREKMLNVIIVEDYKLTRFGLKATLNEFEGISVVAESENAEDGLKLIEKLKPDVVLMDLGLPGMNGIEATQKVKEVSPDTKIIVLTSHEREEEVIAAMGSGANGYCLKDIDPQSLVNVIIAVGSGAAWIDPGVSKYILNLMPKPESTKIMNSYEISDARAQLTERELEVLKLLVKGKSNTEIAKELIVSVHTAKAHVCSILQKLCVDDRVQAAVKAIKENII
jgi:DNA-binding NarL/FixJ family response regulator